MTQGFHSYRVTERIGNMCSKKNLYTTVHSITAHNSPKVGMTLMTSSDEQIGVSWRLGGSPESPLGLRNSSCKGLEGRGRQAKLSSGNLGTAPCVCVCMRVWYVMTLTLWEFYYPVESRVPPSPEHLLCAILSQFLQ